MGYFSDVLLTWLNSSYRRAGVTCRQMTLLGGPRADHRAAPRASPPPLPPQEQTRGGSRPGRDSMAAYLSQACRGRSRGHGPPVGAPQTLFQVGQALLRRDGCHSPPPSRGRHAYFQSVSRSKSGLISESFLESRLNLVLFHHCRSRF